MEELLRIIQQDPELWELVEQLKHQDQEPMEFFENVANIPTETKCTKYASDL